MGQFRKRDTGSPFLEEGAFAQQGRLLFEDNGDFPGRRNGITKEWMWEWPKTSLAVRPECDDRGHTRAARRHWIERVGFQGKDSTE